MKNFFLTISIAILASCSPNPKITAIEVLNRAIEKSGTRALYKAELSFVERDLTYTSKRSAHEYSFIMERKVDTIDYYARAYNGGYEYTENGVPKNYGFSTFQYEKNLIFLNNFITLPAIFENDNSTVLNLKDDIIIDGIIYHVLHITFKNQMPTDVVQHYNLYIDKDTYSIDFVGYDSIMTEGQYFLREAFHRRIINGVTFQNYRTFISEINTTVLDSLPKLLGRNQLELRNSLIISDIKVKFLD